MAPRGWRAKSRTAKSVARRRAELIKFLGGKCAICGCTEKLEFDHVRPSTRTWDVRSTSRHVRIARYWREAKEGLLRLLCRSCNGRTGWQYRMEREEEAYAKEQSELEREKRDAR